jgi:hypothetical protein
MKEDIEILPLANRENLEIKNIDPIVTREELTEDTATELDIKEKKMSSDKIAENWRTLENPTCGGGSFSEKHSKRIHHQDEDRIDNSNGYSYPKCP